MVTLFLFLIALQIHLLPKFLSPASYTHLPTIQRGPCLYLITIFFFTFAFTSRWVKSLENLQMHFLQDSDLTNFCPIWIFHISVHDAFEGTITILFSLLWHSFHNFESWKKFVLVFFVVASRGHSKWVWSPQMNSAENYMTFFMVAKTEIFSNQWRNGVVIVQWFWMNHIFAEEIHRKNWILTKATELP